MNRVDRLLGLILFLQSRPMSTAEEMAAHFGKSVRTIYRDIASLGEAGVPVMAQAGMGYSLARGFHLPPVSFTAEEAGALMTGGLLVERFADGSVTRPLRPALMKILAVLPKAMQVRMLRLEQGMATTAQPSPPARTADLGQLQAALASRSVIRMSYLGWGKSAAEKREVEPMGLIHYLERWHLIAWCRSRGELRDFRTDRMSRVTVTAETFEPKAEFSPAAYLRSLPSPNLRAEVRFPPEQADRARREWWQGVVEDRETPSGTVMTLAAVDWEQLVRWLLTFGTEAEVLAPASLRQDLVLAAKAAAAHHAKIPQVS